MYTKIYLSKPQIMSFWFHTKVHKPGRHLWAAIMRHPPSRKLVKLYSNIYFPHKAVVLNSSESQLRVLETEREQPVWFYSHSSSVSTLSWSGSWRIPSLSQEHWLWDTGWDTRPSQGTMLTYPHRTAIPHHLFHLSTCFWNLGGNRRTWSKPTREWF